MADNSKSNPSFVCCKHFSVDRACEMHISEKCIFWKFKIALLNFDVNYHNFVNLEELPKTPPPLLKDLSDDLIENAIQHMQKLALDEFPCHSQSVERHVKLVTEATAFVLEDEMDI